MKPKFKIAAINQYVQSQIDTYEDKVIEALHYQGDEFIEDALRNRTFGDRTGNLTASIGYIILKETIMELHILFVKMRPSIIACC